MAIRDAASGPTPDNAGSKDSALDRAIAAAMGGTPNANDEFEDGDVPLPDPRKRDSAKTIAGDESDTEDTRAPDNKAEAKPDGKAAPQGDAKPIEAPKHWPDELRKEFGGLGPKEQAFLLKRDKDLQGIVTRKSQELSDAARFGTTVRELIDNDTRQRMTAIGLDEIGYVRYLHNLQQAAVSKPVEYVGWVMRQLGVQPEHLGLTARGQQRQPPQDQHQQQVDESLLDPAFKQLRDYVVHQNQALQQMQARLAAQDQAARDWESRQQVTARSQLDGMWQTFRSKLDDTGQLAHPNADTLMAQMGALMETNRSLMNMPDGPEKLAKAYLMAEGADPDLSKPRFEAEVARRLAEAEKKRETERARRVTSVRPASGAPAVPTNRKGGLDGALEAAWDQLARN